MATAKKKTKGSADNLGASAEGMTGAALTISVMLASPTFLAFFRGSIPFDALLFRYAAALAVAAIGCLIINRMVASYRFDNSVKALQRRREVLIRQQVEEQKRLITEMQNAGTAGARA